jgi:hypothetical protein
MTTIIIFIVLVLVSVRNVRNVISLPFGKISGIEKPIQFAS